jgi:hypothetical protein
MKPTQQTMWLREWRDPNPHDDGNLRDHATLEPLAVPEKEKYHGYSNAHAILYVVHNYEFRVLDVVISAARHCR